ncbi:YidC/Oxa1 family membrane protein insertase [Treponema sp. TIM-1]|uniref:YidC/Oxa1 family membrane protein insertase n=1 Tax=Treponema sp. TIM-1 TaxID=2898417 RepID=UPI00397F112B
MLNNLYTIIIYPLVQIIEIVFVFTGKIFKNTGFSIVGVSITVSLLCLPLYAVAEQWQQLERDIQKKLKPKIKKIKSVSRGDEQYMLLSTYYRQNNYHPVYALRSTFGLLIQIPFFIAAYSYLSRLETLNGTSFLFIRDLGAPDGLVPLGGGINLLPVLMTLINCLAGAVYTSGFPLKEKVQLFGMAAVFLILLYNSPSGLVLYWTMNNVFSLVKDIYYKISYKHKFKIVIFLFSLVCIFLSLYIMTIYKGNFSLRLLLAVLFIVVSLVPWIIPLAKKLLSCLPRRVCIPVYTGFLDFMVPMAALWVLTGFFIPSLLIVSSPLEFSYIDNYTTPVFFIANTAKQSFGFFIFWSSCLFFLFSRKVKNIFAVAAPMVLMFALCNVFLFAGNYGIISVNLVYNSSISHGLPEIIRNLAVLLILALFVLILYFSRKLKFITVAALLCLFSITGLSAYHIFLIQKEYSASREYHNNRISELTQVTPIFTLSKAGKNTVLIMLDRAVSVFLPYIFDESPELYSVYEGFVFYPNTVSFNGYTSIGAPPLFGGYEYTPREINKRDEVPVVIKHNESLLMLPRIFSEAGYSVTVTDPPYPNYSTKEDLRIYDPYPKVKALVTDSVYTKLWIKEHDINFPSTSDILKRNLFWYSIFKIAPPAFRQGIYLQGDWCAPVSSQKTTLTLNGYSVLDYLPKLTAVTDKEINTALIMVNNTTHETSFLQAPEYRPVLNVTNYGNSPFKKEMAYHINAAAFKRLAEWFEYLKEQDLYDNSRIILVSDHGPEPNFVTKIGLPFNVDQFNPLLMVKDFNAKGNLKTDMTFMSNADVPYLAVKDQIEGPINPFTGKGIDTEAKKSPLYIAISGSIHLADPMTTTFMLDPKKDYYVHTNIFDPANWERAEKW